MRVNVPFGALATVPRLPDSAYLLVLEGQDVRLSRRVVLLRKDFR